MSYAFESFLLHPFSVIMDILRKALSASCLKSSAFAIEWKGDECILHGRGWGHGVGLCQIGAAVMSFEGYGYKDILGHYYPGANVERI